MQLKLLIVMSRAALVAVQMDAIFAPSVTTLSYFAFCLSTYCDRLEESFRFGELALRMARVRVLSFLPHCVRRCPLPNFKPLPLAD